MRYQPAWIALLAIGALALWLLPVQRGAQAQPGQRCFAETNFCIAGRIRAFWEQNGGLLVFGFPTTPQREEQVEGRSLEVQWFERNRLELHPENPPPYDVLLGRIGAERLLQQDRDWRTLPRSEPQVGCHFFVQTGHNVCGDFLMIWRASGVEFDGRPGKSEAESLALFGLPLSDIQVETLSDGANYSVQWFERARFERHSENAAPYAVLLGLLGNEVRAGLIPKPLPTPTSTPAPTPTLTPEPTRAPRPKPRPSPTPIPPTAVPTLPPYPIDR